MTGELYLEAASSTALHVEELRERGEKRRNIIIIIKIIISSQIFYFGYGKN